MKRAQPSTSATVYWMTPPTPSVNLQKAMAEVRKLGTKGTFLQQHISTPAHTVVAVAIAFFDTCSYTGTSVIKGAVCMIDLNFPEAYGQLKSSLGNAAHSLKMVVALVFVAVGGIVMPVTCFGSLPVQLKKPAKDKHAHQAPPPDAVLVSQLQEQIRQLQLQLSQRSTGPTALGGSSASSAINATGADDSLIAQLQRENQRLQQQLSERSGKSASAVDGDDSEEVAQLRLQVQELQQQLEHAHKTNTTLDDVDVDNLGAGDSKLVAQLQRENAQLKQLLEQGLAEAEDGDHDDTEQLHVSSSAVAVSLLDRASHTLHRDIFADFRKRLSELRRTESQEREQYEKTHKEREDALSRIQILTKSVEQQLSHLQEQHPAKAKELELALDAIRSQISQEQQRLEKLQSSGEAEVTSALQQLQQPLTEKTAELRALEQQLLKLSQELEQRAQAQPGKLEELDRQLETRLKEIEQQVDLRRQTAQKDKLAEEAAVETLVSQRQQLTEELASLRAQKEQLQLQASAAPQEAVDLGPLKLEKAQLEQELAALRESLPKEKEALGKELEGLRKAAEDIRAKQKLKEAEYAKLAGDRRETLKQMEQLLQKGRAEIEQLQLQRTQLQHEVEELRKAKEVAAVASSDA